MATNLPVQSLRAHRNPVCIQIDMQIIRYLM